MLTRLSVSLITFYQRRISPHKGFSCAHRLVHGGASCSEAVADIVRDQGVLSGWAIIRRRFAACKAAAVELRCAAMADTEPHGVEEKKPNKPSKNRGADSPWCCDLSFLPVCGDGGGCDGGGCDMGGCDCGI
ncbi:membrane protein insertion efficiency factor YidD [Pseudobythopirellula maris]|uniref:membrane protein insertion efficiency factor YidD n=1 Tax=Pseudobythopirellula maris TaxID=2527991 RepID=UPI0011B57629|nr:membrane protein insertion efficiency factor YidD [Pseudobythopirellula maris]